MSLPRRSGQGGTQWMIVYITHNAPEAYVVAGRLETEGIPAMVYYEAGAGALGIHIGNLGEVKVLVHPVNYERALTLLEPQPPDALPDTTGDIIYRFPDEDDEDGDE